MDPELQEAAASAASKLCLMDSLKRIRKSPSLLAVPKEARDPKDDQIVQSFRELLLLEGHLPGKHSDYHTLLRFLRMRDFDLMKAKDMFLQYLKWREEFEVDTIVKGLSNFLEPARNIFTKIQKIDSNYYPERTSILHYCCCPGRKELGISDI
ncbi:hypothetical protein CsSME_00034982 [Camellia sinensis var. sinensis]